MRSCWVAPFDLFLLVKTTFWKPQIFRFVWVRPKFFLYIITVLRGLKLGIRGEIARELRRGKADAGIKPL